MSAISKRKIVLITRATRLAELVARYNSVGQARFYVEHQGADFSDYLREDETYRRAASKAQTELGSLARVQMVDRAFLPNFVFSPDDTVVALGQDGLVANTLKYLEGQPLIGANPDPERWDGRLLPFRITDLPKILPEVLDRKRPMRTVTMAKAVLNDGQIMHAVNDLFIGQKTHTSARYVISIAKRTETQSSSGVVVSTGMGSTGWLKSLVTGAAAITQTGTGSFARDPKFKDFIWDSDHLCYTVREPFPSKTTGASIVFGEVTSGSPLLIESRMSENGVIFSDGIEKDFLEFNSGARAVVTVSEKKGLLVV